SEEHLPYATFFPSDLDEVGAHVGAVVRHVQPDELVGTLAPAMIEKRPVFAEAFRTVSAAARVADPELAPGVAGEVLRIPLRQDTVPDHGPRRHLYERILVRPF